MSGQTGEFKQYVQAVTSRWWLVAIIVVVVVSAVYWKIGRVPARYTSSATLLVTAPPVAPTPSVAGGADTGFQPGASTVTNDIIQLISSRPIAARVAKRLGLAGPETVQMAVEAHPVRGTSLLRVAATTADPALAANMANATAEEFVAYFRETNRASVTEARRFVEEQLTMARAKLEASERALQAFKMDRQMPSIATATSQILSAMASGQSALDAALLARRETEARLAAARARLAREQPVVVASRATTDNPVFRQVQARLVDLEIQRAQIAQVYTPQHPRMEQIAREIADVRGRLLTEARTTIGEEVTSSNPIHARLLSDVVSLEVERAAVAARVEALQTVQRRIQAAVLSLPSAETEFNRLTRENRVLESNYTTLSTRYQEILLRENQAGFFPASLQLIEAASSPARATPSSFPKTAAAGGLAGLVLGMMAALFLESLDDRIRSVRDAERVLGVPVLASVPLQEQPRTAPAPAMIAVGFVIALALAAAVVSRNYPSVSMAAAGGLRSATTTVASWVGR